MENKGKPEIQSMYHKSNLSVNNRSNKNISPCTQSKGKKTYKQYTENEGHTMIIKKKQFYTQLHAKFGAMFLLHSQGEI